MCNVNMEHADKDRDEGSTHAILISDLREMKPQGEREALEKDRAKPPLCIEQPVCQSESLKFAQAELRLSELLRG